MDISRRKFLATAAAAGGAACLAVPSDGRASGARPAPPASYGCLIDLTLCTGCRKCESACNRANGLPPPDRSFEDMTVLDAPRRPTDRAFTVVNRYKAGRDGKPVYVKVQCMHCNDPACVSACIVGALTKEGNGAVVYDKGKCLGCRYCMVACPFQVPSYEYSEPFIPRVRKCTFCFERISREGGVPACAEICPMEAMEFGPRETLLALARDRVTGGGGQYRKHGPYVNRVYGEREVGGSAWLYISAVPFGQLGFLQLPDEAPPRLTEAIQHGVFKGFIPPLAACALLGMVMHLFRERGNKGGGSAFAGEKGMEPR